MSREGFYWHLRDKSRSWVERTKLLRYAWKHDTILLPNKYQTLLDLVIFGLNDRKRWPTQDVQALWNCLCEVLQTAQCQTGSSTSQQPLVLKSAILQIFHDELNQMIDYIKAHAECTETCDVIISCHVFALISPALGTMFTGKPDILITHLSTVLSLANSLQSKGLEYPESLAQLLSTLSNRCQQAIRQRAQPQQTLVYIISKLLEPALVFVYKSQQNMEEVQRKLRDILNTVLFHRELLPHYELYLRLKIPPPQQLEPKSPKAANTMSSKLPRFIENVFVKLGEGVKNATSTLQYLPDFYTGFLEYYRDKSPGSPLQLLKLVLIVLLDIPLPVQITEDTTCVPTNITTPLTLDEVQGRLKVIMDLVGTLQRLDMYDTGKDESGNQLKWFKALASWILALDTRSDQWYAALSALLHLDHAILEPKLTVLLTKSLAIHQESGPCTKRETFLSDLVGLFTRLRQMAKFIARVIHVLKDAGTRVSTLPQHFVKALMSAISQMPVTVVYDVWKMFAAEITPDQVTPAIYSLFAQFMLYIELTDHNMGRVTALSQTLWEDHLVPVLEGATRELQEVLTLLHSFGELQILLRHYHPQYTAQTAQQQQQFFFQAISVLEKPEESAKGLAYMYSKVPKRIWKKCQKLAETDGQVYLVWMKLELQQLKALTLFEDVPSNDALQVAVEAARASLCEAVRKKQDDKWLSDQMAEVLVDHMHLLTNQQNQQELDPEHSPMLLYPLIVRGLRGAQNSGLRESVHVQEDPEYHRVVLSGVNRRIEKTGSGRREVEDSPRKKKRKMVKDSDQTLGGTLSGLSVIQLATPASTNGLSDRDISDLLATLKDQSCLPLEYLNRENTELCITNILRVFKLLQQTTPVVTGSNQSQLVEACYKQLAVTLPSFLLTRDSTKMGLKYSDIVNLLSYVLGFHGKLSHWTGPLHELYGHILMRALKPLLKSKEGLGALKPFLDEVILGCREKKTMNIDQKTRASLVTMEILARCLTKNTGKHYLPAEVTSLSQQYLKALSEVVITLVKWLLSQTEMKSQHCCILGGFGILVNQACKSEEVDSNMIITELLNPVYAYCVQQLSQTQDVSVVRCCVQFVHTLCQHYHTEASLHAHLSSGGERGFVEDTWDALSTLATAFGESQQEKVPGSSKHCCVNYVSCRYSTENGRTKIDGKVQQSAMDDGTASNRRNRENAGRKEIPQIRRDRDADSDAEDRVSMETDIVMEAEEEEDLVSPLVVDIERGLLSVVSIADDAVFTRILERLTEQLEEGCADPGQTLTSLRLWSSLVSSSELTQSQWSQLAHLIQKVVVKLQLLMSSATPVSVQLMVAVLNVHTSFLAQGPVLLSPQSVTACLHSCIQTPLLQVDLPLCCYTALHKAVYNVLNEMLLHHPKVVCDCVPAYLTALRLFVSSLIARGNQGGEEKQPRSEIEERCLISAGHLVERLLTLVSNYKEDFSRVATYITADYVNEVQKVTLLPELKKVLLPGVYHVLNLCDNHAIAQLYTVLSPGVREIFKTLHQEYVKYFKYTGKV